MLKGHRMCRSALRQDWVSHRYISPELPMNKAQVNRVDAFLMT